MLSYCILPLYILGLSGTPFVANRPHICDSVALEEALNNLHTLRNLLFLESQRRLPTICTMTGGPCISSAL
jgi:hypothetical protein